MDLIYNRFQKIKDKLTKKKEEPLSKADQYKALMKKQKDADFYRKQYTGESVNEDINDKMKTTMTKLAKSLRIKSVVDMYTGKGSLSYFLDDEKEALKLQKFLQKSFKRVRKINLDKSKGDTANFVVAADMLGLESVNEVSGVDVAKKVLKNKQREKGIDLQTANLIVTIDKAYDKNPKLQKKFRAIQLPKMKQLIMKYYG